MSPPPSRPEYEIAPIAWDETCIPATQLDTTGRRLRRLFDSTLWRKSLIFLALLLIWEIAAWAIDDDLLLPTAWATAQALFQGVISGELLIKTVNSLSLLIRGYALGVACALVLTALAVSTRIGRDILSLLTAMFNPLPSIALLPIALLWFGLGANSILFVLVHSVLWPLALSTFAGCEAVAPTLRMTGRNIGLTGFRHVCLILIPAALPAILSGLRVGWAFAWRTLIAAELVFGTSGGSGGLGWYIFQNRNELQTDRVFAGLITVVLIGLAIEHWVFGTIERLTVRRWGMQQS